MQSSTSSTSDGYELYEKTLQVREDSVPWMVTDASLHIRLRVMQHTLNITNKALLIQVRANLMSGSSGLRIAEGWVRAPLKHMRMDDYAKLASDAYDEKATLQFINQTFNNITTLWCMQHGYDLPFHQLTHFYF